MMDPVPPFKESHRNQMKGQKFEEGHHLDSKFACKIQDQILRRGPAV